jgi:hypothetical protein
MSCIRRVKEGGDVKVERLNVEAVQFCTALHKVGPDHMSCLRFPLEIWAACFSFSVHRIIVRTHPS